MNNKYLVKLIYKLQQLCLFILIKKVSIDKFGKPDGNGKLINVRFEDDY
jgi:hypothetical protein